ncbi:MAG: retroviral-like aspartic protease family protein [Candidatus Melainabacteria bacterium]|nr:retroviral-like aspartic protease family protein [Candidatus Melainabacteria bacterium]
MNVIQRVSCLLILAALAGAPVQAKYTGFQTLPTSPGSKVESKTTVKGGIELYNAGQYAKAASALKAATKEAPKAWQAAGYYYLACSYYQLGQNNYAIAYFKKVTGSFPNSPEAQNASTMLGRLGQPQSSAIIGDIKQKNAEAQARARAVPTTGTRRSPDGAKAKASRLDQELAGLPVENRIYFTPGPNGHMLVKAYLDNRPINCWFDTGASAHFGKNNLAAAGIPLPRGEANGSVQGWAGKPVPTWNQPMKLRLGNMERVVNVTIEEEASLMPLVGQQFLRGYDYEIDHKGGFITMRKKKQDNSTSAFTGNVSNLYDIPCVTRGSREYVTVEINNRKIELLLDTGAYGTILSNKEARQLGITVPDDAPVTSGTGIGGSVEYKVISVNMRMGPIWKKDFSVRVGEVDGGAIGQDFLQGHRFTIDKEKGLLRFFH